MPKAHRLAICRACDGLPSPAWSLRPCKRCGGSGLEPKQARYLAWLHTLPCCRCGSAGPIEAHHEWAVGGRAYGQKEPDHQAVPLCRPCHERRTRGCGRENFWGLGWEPGNALIALFAVLRRCYEHEHAIACLRVASSTRAVGADHSQAHEGCDLELHALLGRLDCDG